MGRRPPRGGRGAERAPQAQRRQGAQDLALLGMHIKEGPRAAPMAKDTIKRILVALDGSPNSTRALEMALKIAAPTDATVSGLISVMVRPRGEIIPGRVADEKERAAADDVMKKAAEAAAKRGVKFVPKMLTGNTGYNIIKAAHSKSEPCDILVLGSRGHGSIKQAFFGSTSNHVVHSAKVPVLVVK